MLSDPALSALLEQARRNLDALQLLVRTGGAGESVPIEVMRQRLEELKLAYEKETEALTRQVLKRAVERRRTPDRRRAS